MQSCRCPECGGAALCLARLSADLRRELSATRILLMSLFLVEVVGLKIAHTESRGSGRSPCQPLGTRVELFTDAIFAGQNPEGTWQLEITDDGAENTGTLHEWSLRIVSLCP